MNAAAPLDYGTAINLEAEQCVLGCVLMNNDTLSMLSDLGIEAEHFSEPIHQDIFAALSSTVTAGRRADPVTLQSVIPAQQIGDITVAAYMARLVVEAVPTAYLRDYGLAVLESYASRRAARVLDDYAGAFLSRDPSKGITDIISGLEDELGAIRALSPTVRMRDHITDVAEAFLQTLNSGRRSEGKVIPFPLPELGEVLQEDGFQAGNLYGLCGASGEGKTSLMLQIVRAAAEAGHPVLVLSYDQTFDQIIRQMVSQEAGISVSQMLRHNPPNDSTLNAREFEMIVAATDILKRLPIQARKLTNHKIGGILSIARNWAKTMRKAVRRDGTAWGAPMIILDHNRKVTPEDPKAHEGRIAGAVNGAGKAMAEELGAAVLFLNQRNGKGMERYVPRPIAADLFGGEQAREDYDAIFYIYRPERWRDEHLSVAKDAAEAGKIRSRFMLRTNWEDVPRDPEGMAEIGSIKVRYGRGNVRAELRFVGRFTKYESARNSSPELF